MNELEKMNIVIVGHVDHGKSTVIGRLLADTGTLPTGKLEQIQRYCIQNALPFEYAFLIDALKDERRQNITIDSARVFFNSEKRRYILMDAPGHIEFVRNMVTGAARAEAALLVIDAQEGICENSRRHGHLLSLLGIHQIAVLVNKMDLVGYSQAHFNMICADYSRFLASVGLQAAAFIPVSARHGDNIARPGVSMPWYASGEPTVLQVLDQFEKEKPALDQPFRLPVQDIYRFTESGADRRIIAGTITSGSASAGDELIFYPSGKRSRIAQFEFWGQNDTVSVQSMTAGQAVGFTLTEQIYIQRGEIAARVGEPSPQTARRLRVSLFWLGKTALLVKKNVILKLGTARRRGHVETILRILDAGSLEERGGKNQVDRYEVAECVLVLDHPLACDPTDRRMDTSRFVLVDEYDIRGGGVILEALPDTAPPISPQTQKRDEHWIPGGVLPEERAAAYHQQACLVLITGKKGSGRKRLARGLEEKLFHDGRMVYYLGMGSVVYGVDADLAGHTDPKTRSEHVRRMAEIANILMDAGLILILTAIELTQNDLDLFRASIVMPEMVVIWVGEEVNTDISWDMMVADGDASPEKILQVKTGLYDRGVIESK